MSTKHTVTDSKGKVHKRISANRVYSHAVVVHFKAWAVNGRSGPAYTRTEWSSTRALAEKNARYWDRGRSDIESVEILEAVRA